MISESNETATASAAAEQLKAMKAARSRRRGHVAAEKEKAGRKAMPARKAHTGRKKAKSAKAAKGARKGTKTAKVPELLRRPGGVTAKELIKATGWQPHSLRGFLSGTLRKKMEMTVRSIKGEDGERRYSVDG